MTELKKRIYLSSPHMSGREMKYITEAFDQNWVAPLGPNVDAFEQTLADYCKTGHVAALSSGTAALHLALILLGVKPGDEVIVSTFTFSASVNPIVYLGATPVFIDSEPDTWNMDPALLEQAILGLRAQPPLKLRLTSQGSAFDESTADESELRAEDFSLKSKHPPLTAHNSSLTTHRSSLTAHRLPKAIIVVHLYGMPANMDRIMEIADRYGIPVIEDAAEALGSKYKGKQLGTFGKMGVLSFNGNKIITTSGGGALISDDKELIDKARFLATQARDKAPHYQHSQIGYNYRMSNILAGIGRGQMEVIEQRVQHRREIYSTYRKIIEKLPGIIMQEEPSPDYFSNRWLSTLLIDEEKKGLSWSGLQQIFEENNVETRPLWKPMHLQPVFSDSPVYINGTSERLFANGLCLPSGSNMNKEDTDRVIDILERTVH